jgi:hypothetical protein
LDVDGNVQATGDLVIDGKVYLKGLVSNPTSQSLFFDPTTKVVSYGNAPNPDLLPITLDKTNNRVGVGTITPATALDVVGTTTTTNLALTGIASATKTRILYYDTTTKEVSYGPLPSSNARPSFNAYQTSNQSLPIFSQAVQTTKLLYQVEEYDIGSCFTNSRFTPTVPGYYLIQTQVFTLNRVTDFTDPAQGSWFQLHLIKNGNIIKDGEPGNKSSILGYHVSSINATLYLNGTSDHVEIHTAQSSTISSRSGQRYTWFSGTFIHD